MVNDARPISDDVLHGRERAGRWVGVRTLHDVEGKELGAILRNQSDDEAGAALVQRTRAVGAHGAPDYQEPWFRARCDFTTQLYLRLGKLELIRASCLDSARKAASEERYGWSNKVWRGGDIWEEEAAHDVMQ
jgi:hypothetical protein